MLRTWCVLVGLAAVLGTSGCARPEFKEFVSAEGGYKVLMPGTPKEQTQNKDGINIKLYTVEERNGGYMVSHTDAVLAPKIHDMELQARLDGSRDGMMKGANAQLKQETKITLANTHQGRELRGEVPGKGFMRARIFIFNGRLYQLMVVGKNEAYVTSEDATRFLDSFTPTVQAAPDVTTKKTEK